MIRKKSNEINIEGELQIFEQLLQLRFFNRFKEMS